MRYKEIAKLRETKQPNPYPHKFNVTHAVPRFVEEWGKEGKLEKGETAQLDNPVSISATYSAVLLTTDRSPSLVEFTLSENLHPS